MTGDAGMVSVVGDVLPEIALVLGAIIVLVYALFAPANRQAGAAVLALATVTVSGLLSLRMLEGEQMVTFFGTYARDGGALWAKLIVLAATRAVQAHQSLRPDAIDGKTMRTVVGGTSTIGAAVERILRHGNFTGRRGVEHFRGVVDERTPGIVGRGRNAL